MLGYFFVYFFMRKYRELQKSRPYFSRKMNTQKKRLGRILFFLVGLLFGMNSVAHTSEIYSFESEEERKKFHQLVQTLRCPICQNQTLADSDSLLAQDLRAMIYERLQRGESVKQIQVDLQRSYGHFIFFNPPFELSTYILWLSPFFLGGLVLLKCSARKIKKR